MRTSSPVMPLVVAHEAHGLAVVAADLQAVRAPASVARVHGNEPLVPPLLAAGVAGPVRELRGKQHMLGLCRLIDQ